MDAITAKIVIEPKLNSFEVLKSLASNLKILELSAFGERMALVKNARANEIAIWCINGSMRDSLVFATYNFIITPATNATNDPHKTDFEFDCLKNIAERNTNNITGLNKPIYSWTYWNAESRLPRKIGATIIDTIKPTKLTTRPTETNLSSATSL